MATSGAGGENTNQNSDQNNQNKTCRTVNLKAQRKNWMMAQKQHHNHHRPTGIDILTLIMKLLIVSPCQPLSPQHILATEISRQQKIVNIKPSLGIME